MSWCIVLSYITCAMMKSIKSWIKPCITCIEDKTKVQMIKDLDSSPTI